MRLAILVLVTGLSGSAFAEGGSATSGAAPSSPAQPAQQPPAEPAPAATGTADHVKTAVEYGVDLRIRSVHLPTTMLEWFLTRGNGAGNLGLGIDFVRRRGNNELQLGVEYERINLGEGVIIGPGMQVPADFADYVLGPDSAPEKFGWFTVEFTFLHHTPLTKYLALRYGAGLGIGVITGGIYRWDVDCATTSTNASPEPGCVPGDQIPGGTGRTASDETGASQTAPVKYDLPPVFPVVNLIGGVQIKPAAKAVINVEFGFRTLPFFGMSAGYFF